MVMAGGAVTLLMSGVDVCAGDLMVRCGESFGKDPAVIGQRQFEICVFGGVGQCEAPVAVLVRQPVGPRCRPCPVKSPLKEPRAFNLQGCGCPQALGGVAGHDFVHREFRDLRHC